MYAIIKFIRSQGNINLCTWFHGNPSNSCRDISVWRKVMDQPNQSIFLQTFSVCDCASPRHFPSSSQPFSHVQAQQRLCSDPSARCYCHQLVAHQPGHTATPRQKELCDGRPKRTKAGTIMTAMHVLIFLHLSGVRYDCYSLQLAQNHHCANRHTNILID